MDIFELLAFGAVGFLSGSLVVFYALWKLKKDKIIEDLMANFLIDLGSDEELQKTLYQVGGILGQGAKAGIGFNVPRNSKFNLNNFLLEMAGNWFNKSITQASTPSPSPAPLPQPVNKVKDNFFNTN